MIEARPSFDIRIVSEGHHTPLEIRAARRDLLSRFTVHTAPKEIETEGVSLVFVRCEEEWNRDHHMAVITYAAQ